MKEAKVVKASRAKDQVKTKVKPKMKGITNLTLSAIIAKSMDIMLESVERSKETMASPISTTL